MTPGPCQVHFHPLLLSRVQMKKAFQCLASHTPGSWSQQLLWGEDVHNCPFTSEKDVSCPSDLAFICGCYKIWVHSRSALLHSGPLPDAVRLPRLPRWWDGPGPALPGWVQEAGPPRSSSSLLWQRSSILQRGGWSIHGPRSVTWLSPEPPWQSLQDPCCLWGPGARRQGSFTD